MSLFLAVVLGLLVTVAALLGILAGIVIRNIKLRRIRKASIEKPLYQIEDDLSPAEFGCIIDGVVGYKEVVAEVILLVRQGHLSLVRQPSGKYWIAKNHINKGKLSPLQSALMKEIGVEPQSIYFLRPILELKTNQSLTAKGWVIDRKPPLRGTSDAPMKPILIVLGIIMASTAGVLAVSSATGYRDGISLAALVAGVEILLGFAYSLAVIMRGELLHSARYVLNATNQHHDKWQNVYGVYQYIRVSGGDVFTPDYETLDFDGLDSLYPYAVAAGLDKKILRVFA